MELKELTDLCNRCYRRRERDKDDAETEDEFYVGKVFEEGSARDTMSAQEKMHPDAKNTVEQERNRLNALEYALEHYKNIPLSGFFIRNCGKKCYVARGFLELGNKK